MSRVAALLDDGFAATVLTDPRIVGDISGNGRINAADASLVARFAAQIDVPEIPPIPSAVAASGRDAGWFGRLELPARQRGPQEHVETNLEERSTSVYGWDSFSNHLATVDSLMEDRPEAAADAARVAPSIALEDALDELFSGLGEHDLLTE